MLNDVTPSPLSEGSNSQAVKAGPVAVPGPEQPFKDFELKPSQKEVVQERSAREKQALLRKIAIIANVFSRNYRMQVLPAPEGGWYCSISKEAVDAVEKLFRGEVSSLRNVEAEIFKPYRIFYDADEVAKAPDRAVLGVLRHEVGHARNTDFRLFFEGQQMARAEGYLRTSFALIFNALEDPWVNNIEMADSEVAAEQLAVAYARHYEDVVTKIKGCPPTRQLGLAINHYWLTGQTIPGIDAKAQEIFDRLRPAVDRYFRGRTALENFELLCEEIWPVYRELEEKAVEAEKRQELSRRIIRIHIGRPGMGMPGMPGANSNATDIWIDPSGQGGGGGDSIDEELKRALGEMDEKTRAELKAAIQKKLEQLAKQASGNPADQAPLHESNLDLSELAPNLGNTVDRLGQALSRNAQQKLERSAREVLDQKHADALAEEAPKAVQLRKNQKSGEYEFSLRQPMDGEKARAMEQRVQELAERLEGEIAQNARELASTEGGSTEQIRHALKDLRIEQEMKRCGFTPVEQQAFLKFKMLERAMEREVNAMIRELEPILPKKSERIFEGNYFSGHRLNIRKLIERAPVGRSDFYKRRAIIQHTDPRLYVQLIIDRSGSMGGEKMAEALKTAIFWGRVCERFGVPFAVKFFAHEYIRVKDFDQDYNDPAERIKPNIVRLSDAGGGCTNIGAPLSVAYEEMKAAQRQYPRFMGAAFVITDSGANDGLTGDPLRALISRMQEKYVVGAFILSGYEEDARISRWYFGEKNVVAPQNFADLPRESFRILRSTIVNFSRRFGEGNL